MFSLMGNCFVWIKERRVPPRKVTLCLVGLDNAGKTTAIKGVKGEPLESVAPTVGFSSVDFKVDKFQITVYDLGGGKKIRGIWRNYYSESHGVVFVIDAADQERLEESRETLKAVLGDKRVQGKPLLVLANKQDEDGALDEIDICEKLNLEDMVNESQSPCRVETCSATLGIGKKMDKSIKSGFKWLLMTISEEWDELGKRVEEETQEQRELEAIEKKERLERVRKIREEREREEEERRKREGIEKEESEDDDDDDVHVGDNPFKPVEKMKFDSKNKKPKKKPTKQEKLPEDTDEDEMKVKNHKSYASDEEDEEIVTKKPHKSPRMKKKKSPRKQRFSDDDEDGYKQSYESPKLTPRSRTKKTGGYGFYLDDDSDEDNKKSDESDYSRQKYDHELERKKETFFRSQRRDDSDSYEMDSASVEDSKHSGRRRIIHVASDQDDDADEMYYSSKSKNAKESSFQEESRLPRYGGGDDDDEDLMIVKMRKEVAEESEKKKKKKKKLKKKNKLAPMSLDGEDEFHPPPLQAPIMAPSWAQAPGQRNIFEVRASRPPRLAPLMEKHTPRSSSPVESNSFGQQNWGLAEDLPELPRRTKPNTDEDDDLML
ncbi:ADP-ribosylation factor-like protein 13B [Ptychodera flava]|uniref:ADP-ribosylation factor-like protein 13B n=1 Tax=Ptychodera flava TaxID=63121 RepID=UPI003969D516